MPLASLTNRPPKPPAEAAHNRSSPGKVSGKLLVALSAMVWSGCTRKEAAERGGMSEHSLYVSLRKAHVRQWYLRELDVLRTSERARNIHALVDVGDNSENSMARVSAVKTLEAVSDVEAARGGSATMTPGLVIQIVSGDAPPRVINPPTIDHDDGDANE
jgi:hypothetical protein